jgi:N-acyl-D-amino-acid deacylase
MLGVILPPWVHSGGTDKLLERLASPELRAKMIEDIQQVLQGGITLLTLLAWSRFLSPA